MPIRAPKKLMLALGGLALAAVPVSVQQHAAQAQANQVLPSQPGDYDCLALMIASRNGLSQNRQLTQAQRAQYFADLTVMIGFYTGRISHYPVGDAKAQMTRAKTALGRLNGQQSQQAMQNCQNYYSAVQNAVNQL